MDDLISYLFSYKDIKELADLIDGANTLREFYFIRRFFEMYDGLVIKAVNC